MMWWASMLARVLWPWLAQIRRIGARARMWSRAVAGSRGWRRGLVVLPLIMTSNQTSTSFRIWVGSCDMRSLK